MRFSWPPAVGQKDDMLSCEALSCARVICSASLPLCAWRIFRPRILGECFRIRRAKKKQKTPHELFRTGKQTKRVSWGLALHNKSARWLFKEHSCVQVQLLKVRLLFPYLSPRVAGTRRMGSLSRRCRQISVGCCLPMPEAASRQAEKSLNAGGKRGGLWRLQT